MTVHDEELIAKLLEGISIELDDLRLKVFAQLVGVEREADKEIKPENLGDILLLHLVPTQAVNEFGVTRTTHYGLVFDKNTLMAGAFLDGFTFAVRLMDRLYGPLGELPND